MTAKVSWALWNQTLSWPTTTYNA